MNGKNNSPYNYRLKVNPLFDFTEEDKKILIKETQLKLDEIMNEKDCWLQTCGTIEDKLNFKWYKKISSHKIIDIKMTSGCGKKHNINSDLYFNYIVENGNNFKCILRFGRGTGFSNIRYDIR